jgi:hypothetical protein
VDKVTSASWACPPPAPATSIGPVGKRLLPPRGRIFFGVTDSGDVDDFQAFAQAVDMHPAVIETYHEWGTSLHSSLPRWREVRARPMLHISTADSQDLHEIITPRGIATGGDDDYLLRLNHSLAEQRMRIYIRPMGEPNNWRNPYSAYNVDGSRRDERHSPHWYRQAWRRMYLLIRGGASRRRINRRLRRLELPPIRREGGREPSRLPRAPASFLWSPMTAGSPNIEGNLPRHYWPRGRYVDWVATDFFSKFPAWDGLERFYRDPTYRRKPFALAEWALWGSDDSDFARRIFDWMERHRRARMFVYYRGFGEAGNPFRIELYPDSREVLRRRLNSRRYPELARHHPRP